MIFKRRLAPKFFTLVLAFVFGSLLFVGCGGVTTTVPTTEAPTTVAPTTLMPTTQTPTTQAPTTQAPTTTIEEPIAVSSITVTGAGGSTMITSFQGTLQMSAAVLPADAEDKSIVWTVVNGTGAATISETGLLTAVADGMVNVVATSVSTPAISGSLVVTIFNQAVLVSSISVSGAGDSSVISTFQGTLQMSATVLPINAVDKSVVWSVVSGTGEATISGNGLLTAVADGTVTVKATSVSTPTVFGTKIITISNQEVLVASISVSGAGDSSVISIFQGTLQMSVLVLPENAEDKSVVWSVTNGTGEATISETGLLTAVADGTVTVTATSVSTPAISGNLVITISNQEVLVTSIVVTGALDSSTISTFQGTLQMSALVLPANAEDKSVVWTVVNGTGEATISASGLLTAVADGTVTVTATSVSTPTVFGTKVITISNQEVLVATVEVSGTGGAVIINVDGGTLQMLALVLPANAEDKSVVWTVANGTGEATISETGLLTAVLNGTVTVTATSVSTPAISGSLVITISNQVVLVASIEVAGTGGSTIIDVDGGTLQMLALVLPENADDKSLVWTVVNGTGEATISATGLLTAVADGTVTVTATSVSTPTISGSAVITISNQVVVVELLPVDLGTADTFLILAKTGISTTGTTLITGDIGVSPIGAAAITGFGLTLDSTGTFSTSPYVVGNIYASDYAEPTPAYMTTAIADMEIAYADAASRAADFTELYAGDLSGQTLVSGVYKWSNDVIISTEVVLEGSATDVWIFQIAGSVTQAAAVNVTLTGGALAENVFWQVAGAVAIGANAHFEGTILSMTNIAVGTSATIVGKLFAQTAVTLDANIVSDNPIVVPDPIAVESIAVSGTDDAIIIDTNDGTLQMIATVLPVDADDMSVIWTVVNGTGEATINMDGLLTAVADGTVTVTATSVSTPAISGSLEITISNQIILVSSVVVSGTGDVVVIDVADETLQMIATVLPEDATDKSVTWSVVNGTGEAIIDINGLLIPVSDGTVTVTATSVSTPAISGSLVITISNQIVVPTSVEVSGTDAVEIIDVDGGTLQMIVLVLPENTDDKSVIWTVVNGTGEATINMDGLLTAVADGTVTVTATSVSAPTISGSIVITISNQVVVELLAVDFGTAADFTILAKTGISATGTTLITGDIGVSPIGATAITGFSLVLDSTGAFATSTLVIGNIYAADYAVPTPDFMTTVIADMEIAYADAASRAADFTELYTGDLSGQTLVSGVYNWSTGVSINSELILEGSATDVWIFQIDGSLTQAAAMQITLTGGALAENVFWQVAGAVAIGADAHFEGNILCMTGITVGANATVVGKLFAQTAVTLDSNTVTS